MLGTEGKRTALYARHRDLGAKMVSFGGYVMPLSYGSQKAEHEAVRTGVGVFDLSHMGEFRLRGTKAMEAADYLITNRLLGSSPGHALYSPMCREDAGIVDDLIVYNLGDSVLLVVNAANIEKDANWVTDLLPQGVEFRNESEETSLVAIQGPGSEAFLSPLTEVDLNRLAVSTAVDGSVADVEALISRTGYTGEDGFELYVSGEDAGRLWDRVLDEGESAGVRPVGLAARDSLRFEMGYCLYGNDIDETTNPLEAGLGWTVKLDKDRFVGRESLMKIREAGVKRKLVGLRPEEEHRIPRKGYAVLQGDKEVGRVTSGGFAPSVGSGLAMAYVETEEAGRGRSLSIDIRGRSARAEVVRMPFYTAGSRKPPGKS